MPHPLTTPYEEARALLLAAAEAGIPELEHLPLSDALGRVLAVDQTSPFNLPQTDNAAVDGYAVHAAFLAAHPDHLFDIIGTARAGHPFEGKAEPGQAVQVFTGAVMPDGPDCVLMHEDCRISADGVICGKQLKTGTNMRPAGENLARGELVAEQGTRLSAADIGQLAAAGCAEVPVFRPLHVGVISTGDELVEAGDARLTGQIFDSNRPMLAALCRQTGVRLTDFGIVKDNRASLTAAYQTALEECDVIISSGGASDGIEDHTQGAMQDIGAEPVFWRLAMKPGRPMAAGRRGQQMMFCLPGNPVAAFVCFRLLVSPVLDRLAGAAVRLPLSLMVASGFAHKKQAGRAEFLRAHLTLSLDGQQQACLHGRKGAGVLSSLTGADGLVEIPFSATALAPGQPVRFYPFYEVAL